MLHTTFIHLHVHTAYSLSEGAIKIQDLVYLCKNMCMPAVAITDTNNLFGALEFSYTCAEAGIQPIIGCQVNLDYDLNICRTAKTPESIVLLVQNKVGYDNLLKIMSYMYLRKDQKNNMLQVSLTDLEAVSTGLLLLTGGASGPINHLLSNNYPKQAKVLLKTLSNIFPGRTYIEIQRHGCSGEDFIEIPLIEFAYELNLPLLGTNEPFFTTSDMYKAHDTLLCIANATYVAQIDRRRLTPEHYFKSSQEMTVLFSDLPEAIDNTVHVAKRCAFMLEKQHPILPSFQTDSGRSEEEELRIQAYTGLDKRLAVILPKENLRDQSYEKTIKLYKERLIHEIEIIEKMGFPGYFLIVADFVQWAKANNVPVGPGRGSGAGSLVAWALTITDLDPLQFGLLFERFLNPERISMPDFDIDFCQEHRDRVIQYVRTKYGDTRVAQIITFGKFQARAILRDVGRAFQVPYRQVDRICKLIPNNPANPVSLSEAIAREPRLREIQVSDQIVAQMLDISIRLEGLYRHASTHAAGVVISGRSLNTLIPLYRDQRSDMPVTQFNMKWVENAGLIKFDFLGLKTLTVIAKTVSLIRQISNIEIDLNSLPANDTLTFRMLSNGDTSGVFQLESAGMRDVLRSMMPDTIEDIIAVVALYRPGPMDNISSYIRRKHGEEAIDYLHPTLEPILKETYGIIVYQEQVMQIAQELAGYSLGRADLLRRAMGKKIKDEMEAQRKVFVSGALDKGVTYNKALEIFDMVAKFAEYGFNKSHAAAYALISYQTAYLKANYTVAFMAATMTLDMNNTDKLNALRQELKRLNIRLLPPDINRSEATFSVENNAVRYALGAIRNIGVGAMQVLVEERMQNGVFRDVVDFARRINPKILNRRQLESLIKAGALDCISQNRACLFNSTDIILRVAVSAVEEQASQQTNLFDSNMVTLPDIVDWPLIEKLGYEHEVIGFYLSAHPLSNYIAIMDRLNIRSIYEVGKRLEQGSNKLKRVAAILVSYKEKTGRHGAKYAVAHFSDMTDSFEGILFAEVLTNAKSLMNSGKPLLLTVNVHLEDNQVKVFVQKIEDLASKTVELISQLKIVTNNSQSLASLKTILNKEQYKNGRGSIIIAPIVPEYTVEILLPGKYNLSSSLLAEVRSIDGIIQVQEIL